MKRESINLQDERKILTNMILSTDFLREISTLIKPHLFESAYAKLVSGWVMDYFEQYKTAPEKNIQDIYQQKRDSIQDEEENETVAEFLKRLSNEAAEYRIQSVDYSINSAIKHLKLKSLERLKEQLAGFLIEADPLKAEQAIANYTRIERPEGEGVALFHDSAGVINAFLMEDELLFKFPGALGHVAGGFLRGDLVAWLGFAKRGKTWWMWFTAQVAMNHGLKVLFVTLEMTKRQMTRRAWQSMVGQPKEDKDITIPQFESVGDSKWTVSAIVEHRTGVDPSLIPEKQKKFRRLLRGGDVRIEAFPAYSATVEDIVAHLDNLYYYDNYTPDVVIIDYADIIAPTENRMDYRHQLDSIWKKLRGLAQSRNILIVTASQSGRGGSTKDAKEEDVAEDIRKLAHVSKMLVINRLPEESKKGIVRIAQMAEREGSTSYEQAVVLQCLDIGRPYMDSHLRSEVSYE